jgi:hypothetical protein
MTSTEGIAQGSQGISGYRRSKARAARAAEQAPTYTGFVFIIVDWKVQFRGGRASQATSPCGWSPFAGFFEQIASR